ncbi:MAG: dicarboxylate/amino acid:cation symporter, partial [Eubacterium sp.]|nr:dicarboxylate/amino acid:cation symporter [Eubacterium sp.]
MVQIELKRDISEIPRAIEFLDQVFSGRKIQKKNIVRSKLAAEEIIRAMIRNADEDAGITISAGSFLGEYRLYFSSKGKAFSAEDIENCLMFETDDSWDEEANDVIHQMFSKVFSDYFSIRNSKGVNKATLRVHRSSYTAILLTLGMALLGILTGLFLQLFVPKSISDTIINKIFVPVYSIFMNALKMIVGPLVFCSIASSIADFGNLKALGKIAMRVVGIYLLTSMLAIVIGFLTYTVFPIGDPGLAAVIPDTADKVTDPGSGLGISLVDTLVNIVPKNIVEPFANSDMMQIIFL